MDTAYRSLICASALIAAAATARAVDHPEVEPNDNKAGAQLVVMSCGDTITGTTTGTSTTVAGAASSDNFLVRTIATGGLTEYTLTMTSGAGVPAQSLTLRGLTQTGYAVNAGTDVTFSTATASGSSKVVRWYGHGQTGVNQDMYVRVTGATTTTTPYVLTLTCNSVSPTVVSGVLQEGTISIAFDSATDLAADIDWWVYDSRITPIANFGHDETDATVISRAMTAGTYYLALGNYNTANSLPSASDDTDGSTNVLDFPNVTACNTTANLTTMNVLLTDSAQTLTGTGSRGTPFEIQWYQFIVGSPTTPTPPHGSGTASPSSLLGGASTLLTVNVIPGTNPTSSGLAVHADLSSIGGSATQSLYDDGTHGDATPGDNTFSYNATVAAATSEGAKSIPFSITDAQSRSGGGNIALNVGYCVASSTTADEFISHVTVESIDHATGAYPAGGYQNLSSMSATMIPGTSYPITVSCGPPNYAGDYCGVWIDWNGDGVFDSSEAIPAMANSPSVGPYTGSIDVPAAQPVGAYRMRVRIVYTPATNLVPCGTATFGSTEDYTINVIAPTNPRITGHPVTGSVGSPVLLTASVLPGQSPPSSSLTVTANLTAIGGSASQAMYDDGTHGDAGAGDGLYSVLFNVPHAPAQAAGTFAAPVTVTDNLSRTGNSSIAVTLGTEATGACCSGGTCSAPLTAYNCAQGGGSYQGNGTTCAGNTSGVLFGSTDVFPIAVPDATTSGTVPGSATSTINVPAGSGNVSSLAVEVGVSHTYIGDVKIKVTHNGTTIPLMTRVGVMDDATQTGSACNYAGNYVFFDAAAGDVWAAATAAANDTAYNMPPDNYHPAGQYSASLPSPSLSAFDGQPYEGAWTLTVEDWWGVDTGSITAFNLRTRMPVSCGPVCGSADFNCDGDTGTDADIEAFFACLAGNCPGGSCPSNADFNGDGDTGTDADIEAFFRVLAGGTC